MNDNALEPDFFDVVPETRGHFLLESGHHTDRGLTLDGLFADPSRIAPAVGTLAKRIELYSVDAVCGPLLGGAFLAQSLATQLGLRFLFTKLEDSANNRKSSLFSASYRLPAVFRKAVEGRSVAVVDDVVSAGSSDRRSGRAWPRYARPARTSRWSRPSQRSEVVEYR